MDKQRSPRPAAGQASRDGGIRRRWAGSRGAGRALVLPGVAVVITAGLSALMLWSGMVRAGYVLAALALAGLATGAVLWWRR